MGNRLEGARAGERSCLGTGWGRGGDAAHARGQARLPPSGRGVRLLEAALRVSAGVRTVSCSRHSPSPRRVLDTTQPRPLGVLRSGRLAALEPPAVPARRVRPGAATPPVSPVLQALRVRNQRPCGTPEATPRRDPNPRWGVCDAASAHGTQFSAAWGCRARPPRSPRPARCLCGCPGLSEVTVLGTLCPPTPSCT